MTATEFSLIAVAVAFTTLVVWVYWPSRRKRLEKYGSIPLDDDPPGPRDAPADRAHDDEEPR